MKKQAQDLAKIAQNLLETGFEKEARTLLFTAIKVAHHDNPLMKVLEEYGFEPSEVFEYGDDDVLDEVHPSEKSVHKKDGNEAQEIWIHVSPEGLEYGYMHDDGDAGHQHKYFDNLEDLVSHISEERDNESVDNGNYVDPDREDVEEHSCQSGGECRCGGSCKTAAKKKKNVKLNKPFRTPGGPKKFSVYVKNEKGNVVKVNFGDPNMSIKRDDPKRRKSFRARHKCDTAKDPTKPRTWSCRMWQKGKSVSDMTRRKKK